MNNETKVIPGFEHMHIESYWSAEDTFRDKDGNFSIEKIPVGKPVIARAIISTAANKQYIATMTYKGEFMEIDIKQWDSGNLYAPTVYSQEIDVKDFNESEPLRNTLLSHIDKSLCYQEYIHDWCETHITKGMVSVAKKKFDALNSLMYPRSSSPYTFEQFVESGAAFGDMAPACFEEFLDMEYQDRDYLSYLHSRLASSATEPSTHIPVHFNEISNLTISHYENVDPSKNGNYPAYSVIATGIFADKNNEPYVIQLTTADFSEGYPWEENMEQGRGMEMLLYKGSAPSNPVDWEIVPFDNNIDKDSIEYFITKFAETSSALPNPEHNEVYDLSFKTDDTVKAGDIQAIKGTFKTQNGEQYTAGISAIQPFNVPLQMASESVSLFRMTLFGSKASRQQLDEQDVFISSPITIDAMKKELTRFILTTKSLQKKNKIKTPQQSQINR